MIPKEQLDQVVQAHDGFVKALAVNLAPTPGLADDIAQQVFLEFIGKADQWDYTQDIRPLLAQITRFVAKRCWRDKVSTMTPEMQQLAEHLRALTQDTEPAPYSEDERKVLRQCLRKLPDKSRRILEIHYYEDVSSVDIAVQMHMTADAVRRALFRLRSQLRKCVLATLAGGAYG